MPQKNKASLGFSNQPQTPGGKTGVNWEQLNLSNPSPSALCALIDWVQGTFPDCHYEKIKNLVSSFFQDKFVKSNPLRFYQHAERSTKGLIIAHTARVGGTQKKRTDAYLEINATCLASLPPQIQQSLFRELKKHEFKPSRIDLTIDDFSKKIRPLTLWNQYLKGNYTGFRGTGQFRQSGRPGEVAGTFTLGNRGKSGSGKFFCVYDKFLESNGEIDAVRFELRLSQDYAKQAFDKLLETQWQKWHDIIGGYLADTVDFIDRSKTKKAIDCPRLKFWARFINRFPTLRFRTKTKPVQTIDSISGWLTNQVFPTLSAYMEASIYEFGFEGWKHHFHSLLFEARERQNDNLKNIVELYKNRSLYHV